MAVGQEVVSAYNGPADLKSFNLITHELVKTTIKVKKDAERLQLEDYYQRIRDLRTGKNTTVSMSKVFDEVQGEHPLDWLLPVEIYELAKKKENVKLQKEILEHLENVKLENPSVGRLIDDGIALVNQNFSKVG